MALLVIEHSKLFQLFSLLGDSLLEGVVDASGGGRLLSLDLGSFQSLLQPPFEPPVPSLVFSNDLLLL